MYSSCVAPRVQGRVFRAAFVRLVDGSLCTCMNAAVGPVVWSPDIVGLSFYFVRNRFLLQIHAEET